VARFVRFGEPALLAAGACFFTTLAGALFFSRRYHSNQTVGAIPIILLIGATAFDGALIGFQYVTLGQKCPICLSVAATLLTCAILYGSAWRRWTITLCCVAAWACGFAANSITVMPDITNASSAMVFYQREAGKDISNPAKATLIFSLTCPHC